MGLSDLIPDATKYRAFKVGVPVLFAMVLACAWAACGASIWGCASASPVTAPTLDTRAEARAAVLTAAEGVQLSAQICADVIRQMHSEALRAECILAVGRAEEGLRLAADIVDAWSDANRGLFACALTDGLQGVRDVMLVLSNEVGLKTPPALEAVLALAPAWLPACTRAVDAGARVGPLLDAAPEAAPVATHSTASNYVCAAEGCTRIP